MPVVVANEVSVVVANEVPVVVANEVSVVVANEVSVVVANEMPVFVANEVPVVVANEVPVVVANEVPVVDVEADVVEQDGEVARQRRRRFTGDLEAYQAFKTRFDELLEERIPARFRQMNFRDMRGRDDLRAILNGIEEVLSDLVHWNMFTFKEFKDRYCAARRRARYNAKN